MTEWERFQQAMRDIAAVPPETAAAIRRGEVSAPAPAEAGSPEFPECGSDPVPEAGRTSAAARRSRRRR